MAVRYCVTCNREVEGKKEKFSYGKMWFLGPFYIISYLVKKPTCPICGSKLHKKHPDTK